MRYLKEQALRIIALVVIDQAIKIVIYKCFFALRLNIIGDLVIFYPKQNTKMSWGGHFIEILSDKGVTVAINLLILLIFMTAYNYYRTKKPAGSLGVKLIYVFGLAAVVCSLIDKVCWNGSLDYIALKGLFIFDLKDCYITVAEVLFVFIAIKYNAEFSIRDYLKWCIKKLTGTRQK